MVVIFLMYAVLAATFTLAKEVLCYASPLLVLTLRFTVGGVLLVALAHFLGKISWRDVWRDRWLFAVTSLTHIYCAFLCEFWALARMTSAKTSIVYATTPFITALLSYVFYHERLSRRQWLGMSVGFISLLPIIGVEGLHGVLTVADGVLFVAVASASGAWFLVKKLMDKGHGLFAINGVSMLLSGLLFIPTFLVVDPGSWHSVTSWPSFLSWLTLLMIVSQGIIYNLYGWLLRHYSITFITLCGFSCPLFSTAYGAWFLGEVITWHYGIALMGITIGLWLFVGRRITLKLLKNSSFRA